MFVVISNDIEPKLISKVKIEVDCITVNVNKCRVVMYTHTDVSIRLLYPNSRYGEGY